MNSVFNLRLSPTWLALALAGLPACGSDSSNDDTDEVDAAVAEETPDGEGCEHLAEGPAVSVTAAVDVASAGAAAVKDDHHRYDVAFVDLPGGQKGGTVTFAADEATEFHFFFSAAVSYTLTDGAGASVTRESTAAASEACDIIKQWDVYDLEVGTHTLTFAPGDLASVQIVIEPAGAAHEHEHE